METSRKYCLLVLWNIGPSTDEDDGEWIFSKKYAQVELIGLDWWYYDGTEEYNDTDNTLTVTDTGFGS